MSTYNKRYIPSYNAFVAVNKQLKSKVTPEEWNNLWNIITAQVDTAVAQLKGLHDFLTGGGTVSELLTLPNGATDIVNALEMAFMFGSNAKTYWGTTEPIDPAVEYWFKTSQ